MALFEWGNGNTVHTEIDAENRYLLKAIWDGSLPNITFIMLNPSIGDTESPDPTLKRCLSFAESWGYGSMDVVNLYSQIATYPENLRTPTEAELEKNDRYIRQAVMNSEKVVLAWGEQKAKFRARINEVLSFVPDYKQYCIAKTADGKFPRHPLYLKKNLKLIPWIE